MDKKFHFHEMGYQWNGRKQHVMADILAAKSKQCEDFRRKLIETGDKIITHNVPDSFWGSWHKRDGEMVEGRNVFAQILVRLRTQLMRTRQSTPGTSKTTPPAASHAERPPTPDNPQTPTPIATSNRFTPLREETAASPNIPSSPDTHSSPAPDPSPPVPLPKRRRIERSPRSTPTTATGPQITLHRERSRWKVPPIKSQTVVLGDSNINRATNFETKVRSIEFHSFPGATIKHFENLLSPTPNPQNTPKVVILSIGINNRTHQSTTLEQQLTNMIHNASKTFPNASIHIPLINIPPEIPTHQQTNLSHLNQLIQSLSEQQPAFQTIPKLPQENFKIDPRDSYKIHWSRETANALVTHWTSNLN
jgi:hypothetical protein